MGAPFPLDPTGQHGILEVKVGGCLMLSQFVVLQWVVKFFFPQRGKVPQLVVAKCLVGCSSMLGGPSFLGKSFPFHPRALCWDLLFSLGLLWAGCHSGFTLSGALPNASSCWLSTATSGLSSSSSGGTGETPLLRPRGVGCREWKVLCLQEELCKASPRCISFGFPSGGGTVPFPS